MKRPFPSAQQRREHALTEFARRVLACPTMPGFVKERFAQYLMDGQPTMAVGIPETVDQTLILDDWRMQLLSEFRRAAGMHYRPKRVDRSAFELAMVCATQ